MAGNQWTYIDVQSGGTSQPVVPITDVLETLPIAANYAPGNPHERAAKTTAPHRDAVA